MCCSDGIIAVLFCSYSLLIVHYDLVWNKYLVIGLHSIAMLSLS